MKAFLSNSYNENCEYSLLKSLMNYFLLVYYKKVK